jgi:hypothetical protein
MIDDAGTAEARLLLAELYDQITDISHKLEAIEIRGLRGLHDRRGQLRRDLYEKHTALSADACQRHLMFTLAWSHGYRTSDIEQIRCVTAEPPTPPSPVSSARAVRRPSGIPLYMSSTLGVPTVSSRTTPGPFSRFDQRCAGQCPAIGRSSGRRESRVVE